MAWQERIWTTALATLLALAVALVWPPAQTGAALPWTNGMQAVSHSHLAHAGQNDRQHGLHVTLDEDCDISETGCCAMTLCHPALSVAAHEMPVIAADDETMTAAAVRNLGSEPGLILPPPRVLRV